MDIVKKYKELKKKDCVQLIKELNRRGLTSSCSPDEEKICRIIAYDAYNAGRSDYKQKAEKTEKKSTNMIHSIKINDVTAKIALNNKTERANVILTYQGETNAYLKVTEDQKRVIEWLIGNGWMCDTRIREVSGIEWVEP